MRFKLELDKNSNGLSTANSGGKNPHMVFNSAADNATRNLIDYLKVVAEVYLEE